MFLINLVVELFSFHPCKIFVRFSIGSLMTFCNICYLTKGDFMMFQRVILKLFPKGKPPGPCFPSWKAKYF